MMEPANNRDRIELAFRQRVGNYVGYRRRTTGDTSILFAGASRDVVAAASRSRITRPDVLRRLADATHDFRDVAIIEVKPPKHIRINELVTIGVRRIVVEVPIVLVVDRFI